ncbi:MAG: hypothetical protein M3R04_02095, partial [bacterium]|nr:hypothetical protein [bacterium]
MVARFSRPLISLSIAVLMLALIGCGGGAGPGSADTLAREEGPTGVSAPLPPSGGSSGIRSPRIPLSLEQRITLQRHGGRVIPPQAIAALERLGMPVTSQSPQTGTHVLPFKRASVVLPYNFAAAQPYAPGDAGYIGNSGDVVIAPSDVTMAPTGSTFPDNFSYVLYRIDDITGGQIPNLLQVELNPPFPGAQLGVAVYNWAYGSNGRWEPVFFGDHSTLQDIDLVSVPGAVWTNASDDLAFVLFNIGSEPVSAVAITLFEDPGNQQPFAELSSTPSSGAAPLNTVLDAS